MPRAGPSSRSRRSGPAADPRSEHDGGIGRTAAGAVVAVLVLTLTPVTTTASEWPVHHQSNCDTAPYVDEEVRSVAESTPTVECHGRESADTRPIYSVQATCEWQVASQQPLNNDATCEATHDLNRFADWAFKENWHWFRNRSCPWTSDGQADNGYCTSDRKGYVRSTAEWTSCTTFEIYNWTLEALEIWNGIPDGLPAPCQDTPTDPPIGSAADLPPLPPMP